MKRELFESIYGKIAIPLIGRKNCSVLFQSKIKLLFIISLFLLSYLTTSAATTTLTYTTDSSLVVPANVVQITVTAIGGGGGGGGSDTMYNGMASGAGGSGGNSGILRASNGSVLTIANGGGGGANQGDLCGGCAGGNGANGQTVVQSISVIPGETLNIKIGGGGGGGNADYVHFGGPAGGVGVHTGSNFEGSAGGWYCQGYVGMGGTGTTLKGGRGTDSGVDGNGCGPNGSDALSSSGTGFAGAGVASGGGNGGDGGYVTLSYTPDVTAPTPNTISINAGAVSTSDATTTLTLSSADTGGSGMNQMQFSCDNSTWSTAEAYTTSKTFNLTNFPGAGCTVEGGTKTVYVKYSDLAGNLSSAVNDTITYNNSTTTLTTGTDPSNGTISPGDPATVIDSFTFQTSAYTDIISSVVVSIDNASSTSLIEITNDVGNIVYGSTTNPTGTSTTITLSTNILTASTTLTQYKIRVTPKIQANMPSGSLGILYPITAYISSWTSTNIKEGTDTSGATITINNLAPTVQGDMANIWTTRLSAADNNWNSVTYGSSTFVAVANSGTGNRVMTSPDGITWTSRTSASDSSWNSVAYGNGLFVAVANSLFGKGVMTSPDGITWTSRTAAADNNWTSVAYGNGIFVAVSNTGTNNRVMTSPDGITWTSRTSALRNNWTSVAYGNGIFVAVANSGTGNRVMTSPDGITWTSRTSAADNNWTSVTALDGQQRVFATKVDYTTGTNPYGTAVGDINNDSYLDVVISNYGTTTVSVLMNNGNGTFATKVDYTTAKNKHFVSLGDINNDGYKDILLTNYSSSSISILMNNGNGTFAAKVDYTTGAGPRNMSSFADVNNDGYLDIVVSNYSSNSVSVLMNNGNGTFAAKVDYTTGSAPSDVAIGDVNNDGYKDLVSANTSSNSISVFTNNGNGTFATKVDYTTGTNPASVVISDVNNDDYMDVATGNYNGNNVSVFINNRNGTFATKVDYPTPDSSHLSVGDVDKDGYKDFIVPNYDANSVSVLLNNGNGTFATKVDYTTGSGPRGTAMGDLNNDGYLDFIVANYNSSTFSVFLNSVTGGKFVAVANSGIGNRVMTSSDGITWTSRTSASDNNWTSITSTNGIFIAVANSGIGNRVMTSSDGVTWSTQMSASDNDWRSITYGNNTFVAVANFSTSNLVMTSNKQTATLTPGNGQVTVNYITSADTNLNSIIVLRSISPITDNPVNGSNYILGSIIGDSTVACIDTTITPLTSDSCIATGLANGTTYYFKIFAKNINSNYSEGVSPFGLLTTANNLPNIDQSGYQFFASSTSSTPGSSLASQNTLATLTNYGDVFRMRMTLHVGLNAVGLSGKPMKLQYALKSGSCDTSFSGETYRDITSISPISYYNVPNLENDVALGSQSDVTHGADNVVNQTYVESNNFNNSQSSIPVGQDAKYDFSLYDNGATSNTSYCIRAVNGDGTQLTSYSFIPEIKTAYQQIQINSYRFRKDDGDESTATYATVENTPIIGNFLVGDKVRLRIALSNQAASLSTKAYQLEYSTSTCATWFQVPRLIDSTHQDWRIDTSSRVADNTITSHISGISPPSGKSFSAGRVQTFNNVTYPVTLRSNEYTEIEYSLRSTSKVQPFITYCFRLTNFGDSSDLVYTAIPQITLIPTNFRRQSGGGGGGGVQTAAQAIIQTTVEAPAVVATTTVTGGSASSTEATTTETTTPAGSEQSTTTPTKVQGGGGDVGLNPTTNYFVYNEQSYANTGMVLGETVSSICTDMKHRMLYGQSDRTTQGEVSQLQYFLKQKGYFNANVTGNYLSITKDAIKKFQKDNNLIVTGIAGKVTREKMKEIGCIK